MLQFVQRSLLLTYGPVADEAGQMLQRLLDTYQGPTAAVAWLSLSDSAATTLPLDEVQNRLHRLAQKTVPGELAAAGWQLDRLPDVAVYLVLDAAAPLAATAFSWLDDLALLTRHYLGGEIVPALLWLVEEPLDAAATGCLAASEVQLSRYPRGIYVLGLLNAAGFRLPDTTALAEVTASLLYLLIATPLRDAPERLEETVPMPGLIVPGVACWSWDPEPLVQQAVEHWLSEVFAHWLRSTQTEVDTLIAPSAWLNQQGLTWELLAPHLLLPEQQSLPDLNPGDWSAPWPWDVRFHWHRQRQVGEQDSLYLMEQQDNILLQADLSLEDDELALRADLKQFLDEHPVGGLYQAERWLRALAETIRQEQEQMVLRLETQTRHNTHLQQEIDKLQNKGQTWLANWPDTDRITWVARSWRVWQWPRFAWQYHRLRHLGLQLNHLFQQQAENQRSVLRLNAGLHLYRQFERIIQRLTAQVEEIGEMLQAVRPRPSADSEPLAVTSHQVSDGMTAYVAWFETRLVMSEEASRAAAAVGGLGQHLERLDDVPVAKLRQYARERLAPLHDASAVAGLRWQYPDEMTLGDWWANFWQEAAPLWRPDETRMPELNRQSQIMLALCAAQGSQQLSSWLGEEAQAHNITWLESQDRHRLWLLRLQGGLNAAALLPQPFNDEEE